MLFKVQTDDAEASIILFKWLLSGTFIFLLPLTWFLLSSVCLKKCMNFLWNMLFSLKQVISSKLNMQGNWLTRSLHASNKTAMFHLNVTFYVYYLLEMRNNMIVLYTYIKIRHAVWVHKCDMFIWDIDMLFLFAIHYDICAYVWMITEWLFINKGLFFRKLSKVKKFRNIRRTSGLFIS